MTAVIEDVDFEDLVVGHGEIRQCGGYHFQLFDPAGHATPFLIEVSAVTGAVSLVHVITQLSGQGARLRVTHAERIVLAGVAQLPHDQLSGVADSLEPEARALDRLGLDAQNILIETLIGQDQPDRCRAGDIAELDQLAKAALAALPSWKYGGDPRFVHGFPRILRLDLDPNAGHALDGHASLSGSHPYPHSLIDPGSPLAIALEVFCRVFQPDGTSCRANRAGRVVVDRETRLYEVDAPSAHETMAAKRVLRRFFDKTPAVMEYLPLVFADPPDPRLSLRTAILISLPERPIARGRLCEIALAELQKIVASLPSREKLRAFAPINRFDDVLRIMAREGGVRSPIDAVTGDILAARGPMWEREMRELGF